MADASLFWATTTSTPHKKINYCKSLLTELGSEVVNEEYVPLGHSDFCSIINRTRTEKPDMIFLTLAGDSDVAFARPFHDAELDPEQLPVLSLTRSEVEVKAIGGEASAGHVSSAPYFMNTSPPENEKFVEAYKSKSGGDEVTHFVSEAANFQDYRFKATFEKRDPAILTTETIHQAAVGTELLAPLGKVLIDENLHTHLWPKVARRQANDQASVILEAEQRAVPEPYGGKSALALGRSKLGPGLGSRYTGNPQFISLMRVYDVVFNPLFAGLNML